MSGLFSFLVLGVDRPSIDELGDWAGSGVGTGIGLIVLIVGIVHWATNRHGRMIVLFIVGGLLFLVSKGPKQMFNVIFGIWKVIFGG